MGDDGENMNLDDGQQVDQQPPDWYKAVLLKLQSVECCDDAIEGMYFFLDNGLTSDARNAIQRHLDGCGDCLQAFNFEVELRQIIAKKCVDEPPAELVQRISTMLQHLAQSPLQTPFEGNGSGNFA